MILRLEVIHRRLVVQKEQLVVSVILGATLVVYQMGGEDPPLFLEKADSRKFRFSQRRRSQLAQVTISGV